MFHVLNTNIAQRYGLNAALVAQYIWEEIGKNELQTEIPSLRN